MFTRLNSCYTNAQEAEITHPCQENLDIREEILDLITSMSRSARESELRPRIAKHLSGRVRPPGASPSCISCRRECPSRYDSPRASCRRGYLPRCDHHSLILSSSPTSPVRPYDRPRLPFRPNYHPGSPITYSAASQLSTKIQPDFSTSSCRILSLHPVMFLNSLHPQQLLPHYYSLSACTS